MSSPVFDTHRSDFDFNQGFDWSFQQERTYPRHDYRKMGQSPAMTPPHFRGKNEGSPQWTAPSMTGHTPSHSMPLPEEAWNSSTWSAPPMSSTNSERMCLMDLAKENVLLKRQLHDASVQIYRLRDVLHSCPGSQQKPIKSKEEARKNPNQARFWSEDEHKRFVAAIKKFGPKDVKSISKAVKTRTPVQVRTHAQKYFLKIARDRKRQQASDATTDGTDVDSSRDTSAYPYGCSSSDMTEEVDEQAEAAVAAVAAASGEEGTAAAAAAAFVAASSEQIKFVDDAAHEDESRFLGLKLQEEMLSGHEAN